MWPIKIKAYSLKELQTIFDKQPFGKPPNDNKIEKFPFVRSDDIARQFQWTKTKYARVDLTKLKRHELQDRSCEYDAEFDISIAATKRNRLVGLTLLQWVHYSFKKEDVWAYHSRYTSVHEDFRNRKIATQMLHTLEQHPDIQGKAIFFGNYEDDGKEFLRHVIPKIFSNKNYYVLPKHDYTSPLTGFPKQFGCYLTGHEDE